MFESLRRASRTRAGWVGEPQWAREPNTPGLPSVPRNSVNTPTEPYVGGPGGGPAEKNPRDHEGRIQLRIPGVFVVNDVQTPVTFH